MADGLSRNNNNTISTSGANGAINTSSPMEDLLQTKEANAMQKDDANAAMMWNHKTADEP